MAEKKAIVVGSHGQDGKLLCQLLARKNYRVTEVAKGLVSADYDRPVDILDSGEVNRLVASRGPDDIYFLAAYHQAAEEKRHDEHSLLRASLDVNVMALTNFLEAIRSASPGSRLFYASSSHIFGNPACAPQDEAFSVNPNSIYGISKAAGTFACRYYRRLHGVHASVGILYNHESIYRDPKFISKKIARAVARIKKGLDSRVVLGNLDAAVDWGYAPDYVDAMFRILRLDQPGDFVVATGKLHTVRDFARTAFACAGLDFRGYVETDGSLVAGGGTSLRGNPSKLMKSTGWQPSVTFEEMVREMVENELKADNE
jgi:GDPmannose 4,6-dehydratase